MFYLYLIEIIKNQFIMNSVNQNPNYHIQTWREPNDQGKTVLQEILNAQYSVDISIYELGGPNIMGALLQAKRNGVWIRIMFNGQFFVGNNPGNQRFTQQFAVAKELISAPGENQAEVNWASNNFNITHQKTIIIDARKEVIPEKFPNNAKALVMTLNLSAYKWLPNSTGIISNTKFQFWGNNYPDPGKGTRDFGVILTNPDLVKKIETVYESDFDGASRNITNDLKNSSDGLIWSNGTTGIFPAKENEYPKDGNYYVSNPENLKNAIDQGNARDAHLYVINGAKKSLIIYNEEMNDTELVGAIANAASKGVDVKVLMTSKNTNEKSFNEITAAGGQIRLFPNNGMYIHAKVLLADFDTDNALSFVGSQNISKNSLNYNRELGVLISGIKDNKLFGDTFFYDWKNPTLQQWKSPTLQQSPEEAPMKCGPVLAHVFEGS